MSCSPFDLRDYFLKELSDPQQRQVEAHVKDCPACRQELEQLQLTQTALFSLRDEEIPQRIAFVSDPVFEPSSAQRWWAAFWGSPARLGFAGAAMLSVGPGVLRAGALTLDIRNRSPHPEGSPRQRTAADGQYHPAGSRSGAARRWRTYSARGRGR